MARIRTIKPEFFRHEDLFEAEKAEGLPLRLAFAGLWTAADREGRFVWKPRELKLDCLPHDSLDFSQVLDALAMRGFIVKYHVDDKHYGFIPSWAKHQVINNRESESRIPGPDEHNALTRAARVTDACGTRLEQVQGEGKGREGKGKEGKGKEGKGAAAARVPGTALPDTVVGQLIGPALFKMFCDAYPPDALGDRIAARIAFDKRAEAGSDIIDKIIADARQLPAKGDNPAAAAWLDAWAEKPMATRAPHVFPEATALANRLCVIVGHDADFPPPAWMGAAYRVQQWINQGWAEGIIVASVTEQAARKRGSKIERVEYFERGIADAVARAMAPLPTGDATNSKSGDSREAYREKHSAVAAIGRVFSKLRERSSDAGSLGGPDEHAVLSLPAGPVRIP